jgi:hypothetical protein
MRVLELLSTVTGKLKALSLLAVLCLSLFVVNCGFVWHASGKPMLGVMYDFYLDDTLTMIAELERIKAVGFQMVCISFWWHNDPQHPWRINTHVLLDEAARLGLKVYVRQPWSHEVLQQYLAEYADRIAFFQVVNEADTQVVKNWVVPSEIVVVAQRNAEIVKAANPNIKTVASFSTPLLPMMVRGISEHVDIIALDIYEPIQLDTFALQTKSYSPPQANTQFG